MLAGHAAERDFVQGRRPSRLGLVVWRLPANPYRRRLLPLRSTPLQLRWVDADGAAHRSGPLERHQRMSGERPV